MNGIEFNISSVKTAVIFPLVSGKEISLAPDSRLEEAVRLAEAINLNVICSEIVKVREIKPAIFFGNGFLENLQNKIAEQEIELVVIDTVSYTHLTLPTKRT